MNAPATRPGRRLVVLRHGVTEFNARGVWQGHYDSDLAPEGVAQAREAGPVVASAYDPAVVVCSDLARARVTAEAVCAHLPGRELRIDARFREIDVGRWQGLDRAEMHARYPDAATLMASGHDFRRGDDGETYGELGDRVGAGVADLLAELRPGETGLVVTHGVAARVLVGDLLGFDRQASWTVLGSLGNCHWADVREREDGRWALDGWGLRARFGATAQAG